jgi:hypothetical protein
VHRLHELFHHRLGQVPERHRGEVGESEIKNLGREAEEAAFKADITQADQREQDAAGAGAGQARGLGDFGERLLRAFGIERANDGQPPRKGLDIGIAGFFGGQFGSRHAKKDKSGAVGSRLLALPRFRYSNV